jgi:hypothetical protein
MSNKEEYGYREGGREEDSDKDGGGGRREKGVEGVDCMEEGVSRERGERRRRREKGRKDREEEGGVREK